MGVKFGGKIVYKKIYKQYRNASKENLAEKSVPHNAKI
jgi:hypothetical protein